MILKRYLAAQWLIPFALSLFFFLLLITISTLVSGMLRSSVTPTQVLINFLFDLPKWISLIIPFACLSATLFCLEFLRSKNELVAVYAAGFSYKNLFFLVGQITIIVALCEFLLTGYVAPSVLGFKIRWLEKTGANFKSNQFSQVGHSLKAGGKIWFKSGNQYFSFLAFDKEKQEIIDVSIYDIHNNESFKKIIKAKKAKYKSENNWVLIEPTNLKSLNTQEFPIQNSPSELEFNLNQTPETLNKIEAEVSALNPFELASFIKQIKKSDINASNYEIQLFEKISKPLICILFALLPLLGFSSANRRQTSFGKTVAITLVFCVVYWLLQSTLQAFGQNNKIPSFIAVFSMPLIFIAIIVSGYNKKAKLV